ncbi:hypothetical protein SKAU_G00087240 [Synaphobranchus kaupii]|uniref:Uncharacterized protein n=1 Tax=Synaphobranchus kaupii TaxID=118154 RepID=A0A9Q1FVZ4_SYNKA|nr:hypothetical protein SKAU_G00087240 [Synaphobranchus kaupii]
MGEYTGPLNTFLDELDTLLSSFPEDGTPVILLDDFLIHFEEKTLEDTDVLQLVTHQRETTCPLDPIPSAVLQSISEQPARPSSVRLQNRALN